MVSRSINPNLTPVFITSHLWKIIQRSGMYEPILLVESKLFFPAFDYYYLFSPLRKISKGKAYLSLVGFECSD